MKIIRPSYEILTPINKSEILQHLETCGRVCYKSEDQITDTSARKFVEMIDKRKHHSVLEHISLSVRFIHNRGVSHEMVRHRIASFSQESTRYCNYSKDKFGKEITVIEPFYIDDTSNIKSTLWKSAIQASETVYFDLLEAGVSPQGARGVLPLDLKTEIIVTANLREWKHIFDLRCSDAAHPDMRRVMIPLRDDLKEKLGELF